MILLIIFLMQISFNFVNLIDFIEHCFLNDMLLLFPFAQFISSVPSFFSNVFGHYFVGHELLSSKEKGKRFSYMIYLWWGEDQFLLYLAVCWVVQNISFVIQAFACILAFARYLIIHMYYRYQFMMFLLICSDLIWFKANYYQGTNYQHCKLVIVYFLI